MSKNTGTVFVALLTGVALGAAAGILFAPDKGEKTRGKIKDGYDDSKKQLQDKYDSLYEKVKSKFSGSQKDFADSFDSLIDKASYKKDEVIDIIEKKLNDLKKTAAAAKN